MSPNTEKPYEIENKTQIRKRYKLKGFLNAWRESQVDEEVEVDVDVDVDHNDSDNGNGYGNGYVEFITLMKHRWNIRPPIPAPLKPKWKTTFKTTKKKKTKKQKKCDLL